MEIQASVILGCTLSLFAAAVALADVVELKTGERVEGTFKQGNQTRIMIQVGGQTITFERAKVRAIYFGPAPTTSSGPSPLQEALVALKGLQSVAGAGTTYSEYGRRVHDAKIIVDRYLTGPQSEDDDLKSAVRAAMGSYVLALSVWESRNTSAVQIYWATASQKIAEAERLSPQR